MYPNSVALLFAALYGWAAGTNIGLVFSEYNASSIIFVVVLFALTYNQTVSILDYVALALIVFSVVDISYLGNWERDREQDDASGPDDAPIDRTEEHKDLAISVLLAVTAGLIQAFIALHVYFVQRSFKKLTQIQLTFDSLLPYGIAMAPFFIYIYFVLDADSENPTYTNEQILLSNIALLLETIGQTFYAIALTYGKASRVQAILSF